MQKSNLWASIMNGSSKRSKAIDATCVIFGDRDVGKGTLLGKIGNSSTHDVMKSLIGAGSRVMKEIVSYSYVDVEETWISDFESISRINLWSLSTENYMDGFIMPHIDDKVYILFKSLIFFIFICGGLLIYRCA